MKTIFVTIFEGVEAKNILRTPILSTLLSLPELRIVLLTKSSERVAYYQKEFSDPRLVYEVISPASPRGLDRFFSLLKFQLLRTATTDLRRRMKYAQDRNFLRYYPGLAMNRILARPAVRRIVRFLDFHLVSSRAYAPYLDRYQPDLVLCAHLFDEPEIHLVREAKKRGIRTIGFINSWDKVTARCALRLLPDRAIVFNDIVKKEMMVHNDMPEKDIFVSGLPQYDAYIHPFVRSREVFFREMGIDPRVQKLIVYAPNGRYSARADGAILDLIHDLQERSLLPPGVGLLVRFQPNDHPDPRKIQKRPMTVYDFPGTRFSSRRGIDWDMNAADIQRLVDTLFYADLFICYTSSLSVDAAFFDKPVINIRFEIEKIEDMLSSPLQFYQMTHYKNAIDTGGIRVVSSPEDLLYWIRTYLVDPLQDREKRRRLVEEQCQFLDGKSGERVAHFLLRELESAWAIPL